MISHPFDHHALRAAALLATALSILAVASVPLREPLYRGLASTADGMGPTGQAAVRLAAEKGLLLLLAVIAAVAVAAIRRGRDPFVLLVCAGLGTVTAYVSSEALKLLVQEQRPCRSPGIDTVLTCPAAGDWSWPSNHATIAAALGIACLIVAPRTWRVVVPLVVLIALARVSGGVHYVHDVLSGMALGLTVTAATTLALCAVARRVQSSYGPA